MHFADLIEFTMQLVNFSVPKIWDIRNLNRDVSPIGSLPQPAEQVG
jgi:hypothetical protein